MTTVIMDGRALRAHLTPELRRHAAELAERYHVVPKLVTILVGNDPASHQYVRNKIKMAAELSFGAHILRIAGAEATTDGLLEVIDGINRDPDTTGVLLQLPVPERVDRFRLFDEI